MPTIRCCLALCAIVLLNANSARPQTNATTTAEDKTLTEERQLLGLHSDIPPSSLFAGRVASSVTNTSVTSESHLTQMSDRFSGFYPVIEEPGIAAGAEARDYYYTFIDYEKPPEEVPVADSAAIVTGTVSSARTSWTEDKTGVFTEYTVKIDGVVKEDRDSQTLPGATIVVSRIGGSLTFPTGYTQDYLVAGQGFPFLNRRYVLFLWRPSTLKQPDYGLITLFELSGGRTWVVDPSPDGSKYENAAESTLLTDIESKSGSAEGGLQP